eukprot:TRINITY_DN855_c0_g1_i2.p1 TRINITY_DN855_c0_g1~~TRINITY_DN855_c0_g1_i2.p1  ORF type:complete len:458 (+),score=99.26 TRINITY_DN855_c0_g1_i2:37-1374(+)
MAKGESKGYSKGESKGDSQERNRSRGRPKAKAQPAAKGPGRSSSAPGRPKSRPKPEPEEQHEVARRPKRASSTNSRPVRAAPRPAAQTSKWEHPHGRPLKELRKGATVAGVVVNVHEDFGVFFDIGFERNAILRIQRRFWRRFRRGDIIEGLIVHDVDIEQSRCSVTLEDVEAALSENRIPIEQLQEGSYINGVVDKKEVHGIFVNIGVSGCHGRLQIAQFLGRHLSRGQILRDLNIAMIDVEAERISLMLDDVEGAIEQMEMVSAHGMLPDLVMEQNAGGRASSAAAPPAAKPTDSKAKPKAKSAAVEKKKPAPAKAPKQVEEEFEEEVDMGVAVGDLVDGVVVKITAKSVLVDIGGPQRCNLEVPADLKDEFRRGDRVQGMKVEKISSSGVVTLSMDDPELEVDSPPGRDNQPPKNSGNGGKGDVSKGKGVKGKGKAKGKSTR